LVSDIPVLDVIVPVLEVIFPVHISIPVEVSVPHEEEVDPVYIEIVPVHMIVPLPGSIDPEFMMMLPVLELLHVFVRDPVEMSHHEFVVVPVFEFAIGHTSSIRDILSTTSSF
jgi:hypothetical protein